MIEPAFLEPGGLGPGEIESWRSLAARAGEPNPFFEPAFVLAATDLPDAKGMRLLVLRDDERWLACLPLVRRPWRRVAPTWQTWRGMYGYLGTPLVDAGRAGLAAEAVAWLSANSGSAGIRLEWLAHQGDAHAAIARASANRHRLADSQCFERAMLRCCADGEYLSHLKPKHLREARRQRRRMGEELGEVVVRDRAGDKTAVE